MNHRIKTAIFILSAATLAVAQPIRKNGDCTGLTPRLPASSGENWGTFPTKPPTAQFAANTYQPPLTPQQSINCVETPADLVPEIIAHEGITGCTPGMHYLMHFTFDERGRVWAVDARDYPNTINSNRTTGGQGRILILEDTDGDGALNTLQGVLQRACRSHQRGSGERRRGGVRASEHLFHPQYQRCGGDAATRLQRRHRRELRYPWRHQQSHVRHRQLGLWAYRRRVQRGQQIHRRRRDRFRGPHLEVPQYRHRKRGQRLPGMDYRPFQRARHRATGRRKHLPVLGHQRKPRQPFHPARSGCRESDHRQRKLGVPPDYQRPVPVGRQHHSSRKPYRHFGP